MTVDLSIVGLSGNCTQSRLSRSVPFRSEKDLTQAFVSVLRRSTPGSWALLREIDAGVGVADLILVESQRARQAELRLLRRVFLRLAPLLAPVVASRLTSV